jgi:hypothetical protein
MTRVSRPPKSNGTWATPAGEFRISALDDHGLRMEFSVAAEHKGEPGPMGNAGEGHGIETIQGDTALFKPEGTDRNARARGQVQRKVSVARMKQRAATH